MTPSEFITKYHEAFGHSAQLPLAFWYSDSPVVEPTRSKQPNCFFARLASQARRGTPVSATADDITCPGMKCYAGFTPMAPFIPAFVSQQEHYKKTPGMVAEFVESLEICPATGRYLNFVPIDWLETWEAPEGIFFYATPDMLAGLCAWTFFDTNDPQAVMARFGSGCSAIIAEAIRENRCGGQRAFLGGFDPSVRPYFRANELSFTIPMSRWLTMLTNMDESCLFAPHAWPKVKKRILRGG